jgi:hypothetical protein
MESNSTSSWTPVNKVVIDDSESATEDRSSESPPKTPVLATASNFIASVKYVNNDTLHNDADEGATGESSTQLTPRTAALEIAPDSPMSLKPVKNDLFYTDADDDDVDVDVNVNETATEDPSTVSPSKTLVLAIAPDLTSSLHQTNKEWVIGGQTDGHPNHEDNATIRSFSTIHGDDEAPLEVRLAATRLSSPKKCAYSDWHCVLCGSSVILEFPRRDMKQDRCSRCAGKIFRKDLKKKKEAFKAR